MTAPAHSRGDGGGRIGKQLSFLPEPEFCPQAPPHATLADRLLQRLLTGETLTHPDFEGVTGSWRLGAYVHALRELGWPVETVEVSSPSAQCSDRIIARYVMPGWVRDFVGGQHAS